MKIFVWGMGIKFSLLIDRVIFLKDIEAFIDNSGKKEYLGKKVYTPLEILQKDYDAIIVANNSSEAIYKQCIEIGIDINKVLFVYKNCTLKYINPNFTLMEKILGKEYAEFSKEKYHVVNLPTVDEVNPQIVKEYENDALYKDDYIRIRSLLFAANEIYINTIEGEIAEFGVFRGDFAKILNRTFQDRKLYLFDTFEGFHTSEANKEKDLNNCNVSYIEAFKDTNIEKVMESMPNPSNVIIKKGYFPDSLNGLEEKFAFVSLDVDFEESTYNGLEYFYPRLSQGGYIFIHDYNYGYFNCVKDAVRRYEQNNKIHLCKVPICDYNGTMVITK